MSGECRLLRISSACLYEQFLELSGNGKPLEDNSSISQGGGRTLAGGVDFELSRGVEYAHNRACKQTFLMATKTAIQEEHCGTSGARRETDGDSR